MGMHAECDVCEEPISLKDSYIYDSVEHGDMTAHVDCFFNLTAMAICKLLDLEIEMIWANNGKHELISRMKIAPELEPPP